MAKPGVMTEDDEDIKQGAQPGMSQEDAELIIVEDKEQLAQSQEEDDDRIAQTNEDEDDHDDREEIRERRRKSLRVLIAVRVETRLNTWVENPFLRLQVLHL